MKISKALAIALLTESANTVKVGEVPHEQQLVQSSVVKAEQARQLAQIAPDLDPKELAQINKLPLTFEDMYVAVSDDTVCEWSLDPKQKGSYWNGWVTIKGGVCKFIDAKSPIPANLTTWW